MARFDGKTVLITGGTSGIGFATAQRIVDEGGTVIVTGTNSERIASTAVALGDSAHVLRNDAGDPDAAPMLANQVSKLSGKVDAVFLNAGFGAPTPIDATSAEVFDKMNAVNVRGPVLQMTHLSDLIKDGGSVLLTSSVAPHIGSVSSVYALTKSAMATLARSWAKILASRGIRVNSVGPGPIETAFFETFAPGAEEATRDRVGPSIPLGRFGRAEEVAAVATFLLSDEASYVTGSEYMVDGGLTLR